MDQQFYTKKFKTILRLLSHTTIIACTLSISAPVFAEKTITIISSGRSQYQNDLINNIQNNLKNSKIASKLIDINQENNTETKDSLIVSIGNKAGNYLDQKDLPNTQLRLIPKIDEDKISSKNNEYFLSMSHSTCQQFALIRKINPSWSHVSILLSTPDPAQTKKLQSCAAQFNLTLKAIAISEHINIIDALNNSLSNSDVLMALPDASVYNARTIKSILLTTYRHRVPVIGFSESFVRAGALAAISSSTEQLGKQIAEVIIKHFSDGKINNHYLYPEYYDVATNKDVAKSLGITIPDVKQLKEELKNNE